MTDDLLTALDQAPPFAALAVLTGHLKAVCSAQSVSILLADYGERTLERLDEGRPMRSAQSLPVDGSAAGGAFRRQEPLAFPEDGSHRVYVPIGVRADRLGVLDVLLADAPTDDDITALRHVAATVAYVITSSRPFTDLFERVRRYQPLELAAEIQWAMLPALAYRDDQVTLAGMLEPAYEFGGDNFDYAVGEGAMYLSVTDAMGHGLRAAVVGSLAVNALRNARRSGGTVVDQAEAANRAVWSQFEGELFASCLLLGIDLESGEVDLVNAGHPYGYLLRHGRIETLRAEADFPFGMFVPTGYHRQTWQLEAGDRLVLLTDGALEAAPDAGDQFGEDRLLALLRETAELAPPEIVRLAARAIVDHRAGPLRDDVTLVCFDWRGRDGFDG